MCLRFFCCADDAVAFLQRCKEELRPGGMVFVKENVCDNGFVVDREDASLTRWGRSPCSHSHCPGSACIPCNALLPKQWLDLCFRHCCPPACIRRSHAYYVELLQRAGLTLMHTAVQKNFPKGLFKVRMYALKPKG